MQVKYGGNLQAQLTAGSSECCSSSPGWRTNDPNLQTCATSTFGLFAFLIESAFSAIKKNPPYSFHPPNNFLTAFPLNGTAAVFPVVDGHATIVDSWWRKQLGIALHVRAERFFQFALEVFHANARLAGLVFRVELLTHQVGFILVWACSWRRPFKKITPLPDGALFFLTTGLFATAFIFDVRKATSWIRFHAKVLRTFNISTIKW